MVRFIDGCIVPKQRVCPACGQSFANEFVFCPYDAAELTDSAAGEQPVSSHATCDVTEAAESSDEALAEFTRQPTRRDESFEEIAARLTDSAELPAQDPDGTCERHGKDTTDKPPIRRSRHSATRVATLWAGAGAIILAGVFVYGTKRSDAERSHSAKATRAPQQPAAQVAKDVSPASPAETPDAVTDPAPAQPPRAQPTVVAAANPPKVKRKRRGRMRRYSKRRRRKRRRARRMPSRR